MYRLTRFGDVVFPTTNQVDDIGSGETPTAWHPLPGGGALDMLGDAQMYPAVVSRSKQVRITASSATDAQSLYNELMALVGSRNRLYREFPDGSIHWMWARLKSVQASRDYQLTQYKRLQDVSLVFETMEATWRGDLFGLWTLDSGEKLDTGLELDGASPETLVTSPETFTVSVGSASDAGRATVRNLAVVVTAGDAAITALSVARAGGETLTFGGTINATDVLRIDLGTMQVTNDGVNAYDDLTLSPTAEMDAWFTLLSGDNEITVTWTGGGTGSTIAFEFYDAENNIIKNDFKKTEERLL